MKQRQNTDRACFIRARLSDQSKSAGEQRCCQFSLHVAQLECLGGPVSTNYWAYGLLKGRKQVFERDLSAVFVKSDTLLVLSLLGQLGHFDYIA